MFWVLLFLGIALSGVIMVIAYGIWLFHKASDLFSELEMLGHRADELGEILGNIQPQLPERQSG